MPRTLKNTLAEAELHERLMFDVNGARYTVEAMDRYGADLLGRAIGREMLHETRKGLPPTLFYSNLLHQLLPGQACASRRTMAFGAAREVMAL